MKKLLFLSLTFLWLFSCHFPSSEQLTGYVDPFIGTDEDGHTFPGAIVPFGMIQPSPDNGDHGFNWCSGYHFTSNRIYGFSHTHYSGTGAETLCDISVMPLKDTAATWEPVRSEFSHRDEVATPGYYAVDLKSFGIRAELTATTRCGFHRYTFPAATKTMLRLDLGFGNGDESRPGHNGDEPLECYFRQADDNTIIGFRRSMGFVGERYVWFALRTDRKIGRVRLLADGAELPSGREGRAVRLMGFLEFPATSAGDQLMVKVSISSASADGAVAGLSEIPGWNFDEVRKKAGDAWENELQKIRITSSDNKLKRTFYTAVYHNYFAPFRFDDARGEYMGADKKIYRGDGIYTLHSLWDTFRASAPLLTLTQEKLVPQIINSYLAFYRQHGLLPSWELWFGEANVMPGYHAVPVIADAVLKGITGFDVEEAFEAMKVTSNEDIRESDHYRKYGYVPDDLDPRQRGATKTVEYAYDDWCIAMVAKKLGKKDDYHAYMKRSAYWKNVFDESVRFVRSKDSLGHWMEPFSPEGSRGFQEGNAWIYSWYVPQDVGGLVKAMGGEAAFEYQLDSLYNGPVKKAGNIKNHGYYGLSEFSNEPSHHVPYLYSYIGKPWKTAEKVRYILANFFSDQPNGLCGNDDCGQTSAWYVLSAAGFYPVNPAGGEYVLGSPLFSRTEFSLGNGKRFIISCENFGDHNIYIQKAILNGKPYDFSFIRHTDMLKGGELVLTMADKPSLEWGAAPGSRPGINANN